MRMLKIFSHCLTLPGLQRKKHNLVCRRLPAGSDAYHGHQSPHLSFGHLLLTSTSLSHHKEKNQLSRHFSLIPFEWLLDLSDRRLAYVFPQKAGLSHYHIFTFSHFHISQFQSNLNTRTQEHLNTWTHEHMNTFQHSQILQSTHHTRPPSLFQRPSSPLQRPSPRHFFLPLVSPSPCPLVTRWYWRPVRA